MEVHVETNFAETTAEAAGSVSLDGERIFDQHWTYPERD